MDLLILGAGASAPYGFPVGSELRQLLCRAQHSDFAKHPVFSGISAQDYDDFARIFELSRTPSIDLFLTRNPQFSILGKLAVGHFVLEAEQRSFARNQVVNDDWYAYFYSRLTAQVHQKEQAKSTFNSFEFVSFNYDRSFEHAMRTSLYYSFFHNRRNLEGVSLDEVPEVRGQHMYGSLGPLEQVPYGNDASSSHRLDEITLSNLKTTYEERRRTDRLQEQIQNAARIFVLGFGFLEENLVNLGWRDLDLSGTQIYATTLGFESFEYSRLKRRLPSTARIVLEPMTCTQLLRKYY